MRVLVTGISGTGKSSLVKELRRRNYIAYDADDDGFTEPRPDGTWGWRLDLVRSLFDQHNDGLLFFAGCSDEQAMVDFHFKVLLTAPVNVIIERLRRGPQTRLGRRQPSATVSWPTWRGYCLFSTPRPTSSWKPPRR